MPVSGEISFTTFPASSYSYVVVLLLPDVDRAAAREAKTWTSWAESDRDYERALDFFVHAALASDEHFLPDVARLTARVADDACALSLARVLLHCLCPGTPDIYQGDELWNFALVDPDNRRPVDYDRRQRLLVAVAPDLLARTIGDEQYVLDDRTKLALLSVLLRFRREHHRLCAEGEYVPLGGDSQVGVVAFARRLGAERCVALARTRPLEEGTGEDRRRLALPDDFAGQWRSVLTARSIEVERADGGCSAGVGELLPGFQPCELLFRREG